MSEFRDNSINMSGQVEIVLYDSEGNVKDRRDIKNIVVTDGKYIIASRLINDGVYTIPTHMGIGTGTVAAAVGDTGLGTPQGTRVAVGSSRTNNVITYSATFATNNPATGPLNISEAGIFTAITSGTMLCRTKFDAISKSTGDTLTINWAVTVG